MKQTAKINYDNVDLTFENYLYMNGPYLNVRFLSAQELRALYTVVIIDPDPIRRNQATHIIVGSIIGLITNYAKNKSYGFKNTEFADRMLHTTWDVVAEAKTKVIEKLLAQYDRKDKSVVMGMLSESDDLFQASFYSYIEILVTSATLQLYENVNFDIRIPHPLIPSILRGTIDWSDIDDESFQRVRQYLSSGATIPITQEASLDYEILCEEEIPAPQEQIPNQDLIDTLNTMLNRLDGRSQDVIRMRYGLPPYTHPHLLREMSSAYGVSEARIRQVLQKAMRPMRHLARRYRLKQYLPDEMGS